MSRPQSVITSSSTLQLHMLMAADAMLCRGTQLDGQFPATSLLAFETAKQILEAA